MSRGAATDDRRIAFQKEFEMYSSVRESILTTIIYDNSALSPLRGSLNRERVTQGSQSLALGLDLDAAPQLIDLCSRRLWSQSVGVLLVRSV
jgi:hypothetical protein